MNRYKLEVWYRYDKFEKDFEIIEIDADTEAEAKEFAKDLRDWVFRIIVLEINDNKVLWDK